MTDKNKKQNYRQSDNRGKKQPEQKQRSAPKNKPMTAAKAASYASAMQAENAPRTGKKPHRGSYNNKKTAAQC